ncbi:MAG: hypothetical protein C4547_12830 [Phycisphaerales bacterium]|nr:MAG: hypothetical protein C4547_12830 [Phycisphaerales bacterium]
MSENVETEGQFALWVIPAAGPDEDPWDGGAAAEPWDDDAAAEAPSDETFRYPWYVVASALYHYDMTGEVWD